MHSSDTALVEAPADVTTGIFLCAAASRSMLSRPTPARPMHFNEGACSIRAAVRVVALRTITPSALDKASCNDRSSSSSIFAPRSASRSKPQGAKPSVTSTVGCRALQAAASPRSARIVLAGRHACLECCARDDGVRVLRSSERLVVQPACAAAGEHTAKAKLLAPRQALRSRFWASPAPVASTDCLH